MAYRRLTLAPPIRSLQCAVIVHVNENSHDILEALTRMPGRFAPCMHFGAGDSAVRFLRIYAMSGIWQTPATGNSSQICHSSRRWRRKAYCLSPAPKCMHGANRPGILVSASRIS